MVLRVLVILGALVASGALLAFVACGSPAGSRTNVTGGWDGGTEDLGDADVTGLLGGEAAAPFTAAIWVGETAKPGYEDIYLFTQPVTCDTLRGDGGWSTALLQGTGFVELKVRAVLPGTYALYPQGRMGNTIDLAKLEYYVVSPAPSPVYAACGLLHVCSTSDCSMPDAGSCAPLDQDASPPPILDDAGPFGDASMWGALSATFGNGDYLGGTFHAVLCPYAHEL